jgi:hypothetical protein
VSELANTLRTSRPIARVATVDGRMLTVVRHPYHLSITDHPAGGHGGWTMQLADARALGEALLKSTSEEG